MELKLIEFLKTNANWKEVLAKPPYCLTIKEEDGFILLKYNQIDSNFNYELVRECRGIILDKHLKPVCIPFFKFGNYGESYCPDIDWKSARVQEKVDGCFTGEDYILLADGTKRKIKHIVKNKESVEVLSYNFQTNKFEPKKVIGWKVSDKLYPTSDWLTIKLRNVRQSLNINKTSQHCIITPTKNHIFFRQTENGYEEVLAENLNVGDKVYTPIKSLNEIEKQVCLGTLLGDGSCTFVNKSTHKGICFCHSIKQKDYCKFKSRLLSRLNGQLTEFEPNNSYGKNKIRFQTIVDPAISKIYNQIYDEQGHKRITEEYLKQLNWFGFAIWYMDDGSLQTGCKSNSIHLHTEGFSETDVKTINKFYNKLGFKNYIQCYKGYYIINFSTKASELIWKRIREFIIPSMYYKLPERHRGFYKDLTVQQNNDLELSLAYIESIEQGLKSHNPYNAKEIHRYDIEVEDNHNYFCQGVLVHNSLIKIWFYGGKWRVSTNGTIDAYKSDIGQSIFSVMNIPYQTFGGLFDKAKENCGLDFDRLDKNKTYIFELVSPYNKIVVPYKNIEIYHIGTRDNITFEELDEDIGVQKPKQYDLHTLEDCIATASKMPYNEEGYVVVDKNWNRVKIKSPQYVAVHHLKNNGDLNFASLVQLVRANEVEEFCIYFPEYKEYVIKLKDKIDEIISELENEVDILKTKKFDTQKDFALEVKDKQFSAFYFGWNKDKSITPRQWFWEHTNNKIKEWLKCLIV